uniref:IS66-like element accessory protein TnpA n=1 Tax=Yersinia frederiksenii TaxID=29484 RepID=UPI001F4BFB16|nr:IS66-like element accessory protein TnpA [Yersinia frederiksenii]ULG19920.1 transposase [Yersinia frederiksenii]
MKHRTWLLDALRLHFDEQLPRLEAGRRLGIPKTTVCELFVRFRKSGLQWPLPASITDKKLEKRLYRQALRVPVVVPAVPVPAEAPMARKHSRRPNFPREFKIALVEQSMQPGVSVAQLARENNINDNLLFNWRRLYQQGLLTARTDVPVLLPVTLSAVTCSPGLSLAVPSDNAPSCELVLPAGTLYIRGELTPGLLQMLIREMQGGAR